MHFDFEELTARACYRLLVDTVVPRPIAFVTTVDREGRLNAAPFSFFNVMGHDPPLVVLGVEQRSDGRLKDTAANIRATREFVVNLVSEPLAHAMNVCSAQLPPEIDEVALTGLETASSEKIGVPRLVAAPASLECAEMMSIGLGEGRTLIVGTVVAMQIDDAFYDATEARVRTKEMRLIGRMHGSGWYTRTTDLLWLERPSAGEVDAMIETDDGHNES